MIREFVLLCATVSMGLAVIGCQNDPAPKKIRSEKAPTREPEAISLLGEPLFAPDPSSKLVEQYEAAKRNWEAAPDDVDAIIWFGRRTAYLGRYREAIEIYSRGIELHPDDARLYRHRGHRYISTRKLDEAVTDFEIAADLIEGTGDAIEPDGMPNALGIPVSTLHSNIWYHLGLAHYLRGDFEHAVEAYRHRQASNPNNDMMVSTTHWLYMSLRRLGRDTIAAAILEPISPEMEIIENTAYHHLCLFYKGEMDESELTGGEQAESSNAAIVYGLGIWHLSNGRPDEAMAIFEELTGRDQWASFGFIAAEAELARARSQ